MAKVVITKSLEREINKKFKKESIKIFELLYSLRDNPKKGRELTQIGGIVLKEVRYKNFRFYFITDGLKIKLLEINEFSDLLIRFVAMSDKKSQQKTINKIKFILKSLGERGFD